VDWPGIEEAQQEVGLQTPPQPLRHTRHDYSPSMTELIGQLDQHHAAQQQRMQHPVADVPWLHRRASSKAPPPQQQ
jgi:hypothetical protein